MSQYDIGFLGGGQLARMSIQAAQKMGLRCVSLDPATDSPASQVAHAIGGSLNSVEKIAELISSSERVTLENEFIPASAITEALKMTGRDLSCVIPGVETLATVQDKLLQRHALHAAGVSSPLAVAIEHDGEEALQTIGFPMVLKARFGGYDGKGTRYAHNLEEWTALKPVWSGGGWMAEQFVPFRRELAVMVAIGPDYRFAFPTVETVQRNSVCDQVLPATADGKPIAIAAIEAVKGHGLFGVELFEHAEGGRLLVNEIAPRPHNSGHYTLDWGGISQFEMHIRTVMGWEASEPRSGGYAVMANLFGQEKAGDFRKAEQAALTVPGVSVHWYGKADAKPDRKMGHLNAAAVNGDPIQDTVAKALKARQQFYQAWTP